MEYLPGIAITLLISTTIAIIWARGIINMHKQHPDYKGDDFLDWENAEAPWVDDWNEDKAHTEGEIG